MLNNPRSQGTHVLMAIAITAGSLLIPYEAVKATPTDLSASVNVVPSSVSSNYLLGPGDQLSISVYGYTEFDESRNQVVRSDGMITLPLIQDIRVAGRTTEQVAQDITNRLQTYLVDPAVTVSLVGLRPVIVTVSGEVLRPGPVQIRGVASSNNFNNNASEVSPTVSSALTLAGGITQNADIRQVVIRRLGSNNTAQPTTVNLWDAIGSENIPPNLVLQDGDSIYVPRLAEGDVLDRRLIARSSFAPTTVRVRVVGEVTAPGEVQVPPNSSLSSAVAIAGGPTREARLSRVMYVRLNDEGRIEQQRVDLRSLNDTYQIQDGDVIMVPRKTSDSILDIAGRLISPLGFILNLIQ